MKTYSREHWLQAQDEWDSGEFSDEWKPYRHAAAMRGFIYPPEGSKWDSWADDEPSQRAILIQAIRERPRALMESINRCRSWHEVIGEFIRDTEWLTERSTDEERYARKDRLDSEPTAREAAESMKAILARMAS